MTDTAGMRETLDPVEAEGVAVAHQTAQQADLVLSVVDCSNCLPTLSTHPPETTSSHAITVISTVMITIMIVMIIITVVMIPIVVVIVTTITETLSQPAGIRCVFS